MNGVNSNDSGRGFGVSRFRDLPGNYALYNGASAPVYIAGNVGIGTANPQHLLHVAGTIGAEEVIVSSTGADYVFEPDYKLKPLSEVAAYVKRESSSAGLLWLPRVHAPYRPIRRVTRIIPPRAR